MQIIRFRDSRGEIHTGCDFDGQTAAIITGDIFDRPLVTDRRIEVVERLAPMDPRAILCIGLNYKSHAAETGMETPQYPVLFMKNPASVTGPDSPIVIPDCCSRKPEVDYEAELAVVMGRAAKNVTPEQALDHVFGYTCANDVSARRWQKHAGGGQFVRGKSFDTFCPLGPALFTKDEIPSPQTLDITLELNGRTMQQGNTWDMIFSVAQIISFLSQGTTLVPGTVILTGTPGGVGFTRKPPVFLKPGDVVRTTIGPMGTLVNQVAAEK
ncbi:MAG: fumarylacetoacetate hydrolase family protein [Desulfobacterium sp.]|jgi:2-keto-4-pentenoate hydratase/2-oxohepta-3-ene-1,7-dioic acid hydratase in catechol pathway|nr:fumarylacetoacetate hydrolase family protein [Desulfobacterium sp.]